MKGNMRTAMVQGVNLTPQLLQSIRLLQLTAPQLEQELRQALERNPLLERDDAPEPAVSGRRSPPLRQGAIWICSRNSATIYGKVSGRPGSDASVVVRRGRMP